MSDVPPEVKRIKSFRSKQFRTARNLLSLLKSEQVECDEDETLDRMIEDLVDIQNKIGVRIEEVKSVIEKAKKANEKPDDVEEFEDRGVDRGSGEEKWAGPADQTPGGYVPLREG